MNMAKLLNNWALVKRVVAWGWCLAGSDAPPEAWFWAIQGVREEDGEVITTSEVDDKYYLLGDLVRTASGSVYQLS